MAVLNEKIDPGTMDRIISIYQVNNTKQPNGEDILTPQKIQDVWAAIDYDTGQQGGKEEDAGGKLTDFTGITFTVRYLDYLTPKHYLAYAGDDYDIYAIEEVGRRQFTRIKATRRL